MAIDKVYQIYRLNVFMEVAMSQIVQKQNRQSARLGGERIATRAGSALTYLAFTLSVGFAAALVLGFVA